jgi:hypothetical protein
MNWLQFLSPVTGAAFGAIGAVLGYLFKFYLDRRKAAEERTFADKREHYRNLLLCLKSLREGSSEHTEMLWYEYSFRWLHAPDPVIKSANALVTKIKQSSATADDLAPFVGDLLLQIRRDMGFPKTSLLQTDFKGRLG